MSRSNSALAFGGGSTCRSWLLAAIGFASWSGCVAASDAATIVDLQVIPGKDSTEVIFVLDEPAGYRLERNRVWSRRDRDEVVLAIDAESSDRKLEGLEGLVTHLSVYEGGSDPTAVHIGLREPGLLVRDSVLVSPPRLVLKVSRSNAPPDSLPPFPAAPAQAVRPEPSSTGSLREVRVGSHPSFSRLVFELDAPASYRLEKEGSSGLLVTLAATSDALNLRSTSQFIDSVQVEKGNAQTVARVHLSRSNLRIKEHTLSNPHRIVIDVMAD